MTNTFTVTPSDASETATGRVIDHTPEAVFAAFSDPKRLAAWWGPNGFTNTFEHFDFRKHGEWRFTMHGPDGANYTNTNVFDDVTPSRVVIRHVSQPHFTLTVTMDAEGSNATRLVWRQKFESADVLTKLAHIVVPANEQNLDRLETNLEQPS